MINNVEIWLEKGSGTDEYNLDSEAKTAMAEEERIEENKHQRDN